MSTITVRPATNRSFLSTLRDRPWMVVAMLLPAGIAAQITIDWMLGEVAEYYNAFGLVEAWGQILSDGRLEAGHEFMIGQASLGTPLSMLIGSIVLVLEPGIVIAALVFSARWIATRFGSEA